MSIEYLIISWNRPADMSFNWWMTNDNWHTESYPAKRAKTHMPRVLLLRSSKHFCILARYLIPHPLNYTRRRGRVRFDLNTDNFQPYARWQGSRYVHIYGTAYRIPYKDVSYFCQRIRIIGPWNIGLANFCWSHVRRCCWWPSYQEHRTPGSSLEMKRKTIQAAVEKFLSAFEINRKVKFKFMAVRFIDRW